MATLRLAGIAPNSIVDGSGIRFAIFVQGCSHHCPGCHNPQTHDPEGGYEATTEELWAQIQKDPLLSGVTFSGGEPMEQPEALLELAERIAASRLSLIIYTGYTYEKLLEMAQERPAIAALLNCADFLVDGPFLLEQRDLTLRFRGSANQRILDLAATRDKGEPVFVQW